ncbi:MAG: hypothetical protein BWX80_02878 [Candidatus Hydrogenedentes bacterium ADurb.Bin101]|mgnify:CR=1 FL=1|jgi:hypothetical protein|nr:MAG: hypothetical protein BWX80_02878 [Candidatus Hydrogenedentes bacterium ADurb.Bin101]
MERAGVFSAVQLGEWGYYFHNRSHDEYWWRDVFGKDFDAYKHLMKQKDLAGYDRRPETKRECYEVLKDYFTSKSGDMLDRVMSVTGHSHYEAYAGEWGARCIGLELGENIAFTQSKLAFARGASRLGHIEVLKSWINPDTGRSAALSNEVLARLCRDLLPINVTGDAIQYQVNKTPVGWVVELVNNLGVVKHKDQPAVTEPTAIARVTLNPRVKCSAIRAWRSGRTYETTGPVLTDNGPGATEFVEFILVE